MFAGPTHLLLVTQCLVEIEHFNFICVNVSYTIEAITLLNEHCCISVQRWLSPLRQISQPLMETPTRPLHYTTSIHTAHPTSTPWPSSLWDTSYRITIGRRSVLCVFVCTINSDHLQKANQCPASLQHCCFIWWRSRVEYRCIGTSLLKHLCET